MATTAPEVLHLTEADRDLIRQAAQAFRTDFVYLEAILWAKRGYRPPSQSTNDARREARKAERKAARQRVADTLEALEPRLAKYVELSLATGCWVWTGALTGSGQPVLRLGPENRVLPVRRWLYEQAHGPVPDRTRVKTPPTCKAVCVNPDHLRVTDGSRIRSRLSEAHAVAADTPDEMTAQTMMTHRAEVSRFAEVMEHGTPTRVWSVVAESVACLYSKDQAANDPTWTPEQRAQAEQRGTLFALPGADIQPGDRVTITRPPLGSFEILPDPSLIPTLHSLSHREYQVRSVG